MPDKLVPVQIMLVEDNPHDIEITRRAFERGHVKNELIVARDGEEALEILEKKKISGEPQPRLILLDLNLPKMSGHEVLTAIKADPSMRRIPVIILSASSREEDIVRSYNLGVNTFIPKPVRFEDFVTVISTIQQYWILVAALPPER